jgi:hypothetical protein
MKLLTEYSLFDYKEEDVEKSIQENNGNLILSGIIQKANTLNQNGRVYPRHILEREVKNYQKFILESRALGELDHPTEAIISLKTVSHMVMEARMEGDVVYGKLKVLNTSCGKELQALIKDGVKIGISSRGVGSLKKEGDQNVVQEDFQLICFDIVSEPSTPGAFVMKEGREISDKELAKIFDKSDRIARILSEILLCKK